MKSTTDRPVIPYVALLSKRIGAVSSGMLVSSRRTHSFAPPLRRQRELNDVVVGVEDAIGAAGGTHGAIA